MKETFSDISHGVKELASIASDPLNSSDQKLTNAIKVFTIFVLIPFSFYSLFLSSKGISVVTTGTVSTNLTSSALAAVCLVLLIFSKQIWMNKFGAGIIGIIVLWTLWVSSWISLTTSIFIQFQLNVQTEPAVPINGFNEISQYNIVTVTRFFLALAFTSPPILLGLLLFSDWKWKPINKTHDVKLAMSDFKFDDFIKYSSYTIIKKYFDSGPLEDTEYERMRFTALKYAILSSRTDLIIDHIERGFGLDVQFDGTTALMLAAITGNVDNIHLIAPRCDVNRLDEKHQNALFYAVKHDQILAVEALVHYPIKLDQLDARGKYADHYTKLNEIKQVIQDKINKQNTDTEDTEPEEQPGHTIESKRTNTKWLRSLFS